MRTTTSIAVSGTLCWEHNLEWSASSYAKRWFMFAHSKGTNLDMLFQTETSVRFIKQRAGQKQYKM